jgi:hypothetical protein
MPGGRPSKYTKALAARICERMCEGESLRKICADPKMPHMATVLRWVGSEAEDKAGFREQYARAREAQADKFADELVDIADEGTNENANIIRLRMDARKWAASKLAPKKYGDKQTTEHEHKGEVTLRWKS